MELRRLKGFTVHEYLALKEKGVSDDAIAQMKGVHPNVLLYWKRKNELVYKVDYMISEHFKGKEKVTAEEFSDFVHFMRTSIALTKRDFAAAMGVPLRTIVRWEDKQHLPSDVHKIIRTMRLVVKLRIKNKRLIA